MCTRRIESAQGIVLTAVVAALLASCGDGTIEPPVVRASSVAATAYSVAAGTAVIDAGSYHSCHLGETGSVTCWGSNATGQRNVPPGSTYTTVRGQEAYTCAIRSTGELLCWGGNSHGQLDSPPGTYVDLSAGQLHACALNGAGEAVCWGDNSDGQRNLAPGTYVQIATAWEHTCGLLGDGRASCAGSNAYGQFPPGDVPYRQVTANGWHTCVIRVDDSAECWGRNNWGQTDAVPGAYRQISAGEYHTCAIRIADDGVTCWGLNSNGQATPPAGPFRSIDGGDSHNCGILANGKVVCWGYDSFGQRSGVPSSLLNRPPAVSVTNAAGVEGTPVGVSVTAVDPEGDPLSLTWRLGDGRTGSGPLPTSIVYVNDGHFEIEVTARDPYGAAGEGESFASIADVRPSVAFSASPTVAVVGDTVVASASFSDPGTADGPWTWFVHWADGRSGGTQSVPSSFSARHAYGVPGQYTIALDLFDRDHVLVSRHASVLVVLRGTTDIQPARLSLGSTGTVSVYLLSSTTFDATQASAASARLLVNGLGDGVAPMQRNGVYSSSITDVNRDGRQDRLIVFRMADLVAAGLTTTSALVLRDITGPLRYQGTDASPPPIVP